MIEIANKINEGVQSLIMLTELAKNEYLLEEIIKIQKDILNGRR
jgi:hypothetical protein